MVNRDGEVAEKIKSLRKEYQSGFVLDEEHCQADPLDLFSQWFELAIKSGIVEPNAMVLATVGADGKPSARVLLMKKFSSAGFYFYSNYESRKGKELEGNASAALVFFWPPLERQVRIEGAALRISREESERYFSSRPRGSQLGAASSNQSQVIAGRPVLEERHQQLDAQFKDSAIPCPPNWGGYLLQPEVYEFWQGKENRLHDRIRYRLLNSDWLIERLSP